VPVKARANTQAMTSRLCYLEGVHVHVDEWQGDSEQREVVGQLYFTHVFVRGRHLAPACRPVVLAKTGDNNEQV